MAEREASFTESAAKKLADMYRQWKGTSFNANRYRSTIPRFIGGGTSLVHFQLVEDLTLGSHAEAQVLKLSHPDSTYIVDEDAAHIEVYDHFKRNPSGTEIEGIASPGMWAGKQYMWGFAQKRSGANPYTDDNDTGGTEDDETREKYDIVWMEQIAASIMFQTTGPVYSHPSTGGLAVQVEVIRYDHQGIHPVEVIAEDEEGHITIHLPFFFQDTVQTGAFGLAEYDYSDEKYYVHEIYKTAVFATATLAEDLTGNEFPAKVDISGFAVIPHGWHQLEPATEPTTAENPYGHCGPQYSKVLLLRVGLDGIPEGGDNDDQKFRWAIIDIDKRDIELVIDFKFGAPESGPGSFFQMKKKTIRAEWVDPETPETWENVVEAKPCFGEE